MKNKGEKRNPFMGLIRRVTRGRNSLLFLLVNLVFAILVLSSGLYLAATSGVLRERSTEFALNGLVAALGAAYPAAEASVDAGMSNVEVLDLVGHPDPDSAPLGTLLPFILENEGTTVAAESGLPPDLASEIERSCRDGKYLTHTMRSTGAVARISHVKTDESTWLTAAVPLSDTGKCFGLASNTTLFATQARRIGRDLLGALAFAYMYFLTLLVIALRIIIKPLKTLTKAAREYARGDLSHRVTVPTTIAEVEVLADAFNTMGFELKRQHNSLETYSQKLEEANKKAITAVDKLSLRNHEQRAMIETTLEANNLALPEEVIRLIATRLRDDLKLRPLAFYLRDEAGEFSPVSVGGIPIPAINSADKETLESVKWCHETKDLRLIRAPDRDPSREVAEGGDLGELGRADRLLVPLSAGSDRAGVLELVARSGHRLDPETLEFCRHFASHMDVIIRNKALYQETVRRSRELEHINQISQAISGELDMDRLLKEVVEHTQHTMRAECAFIGLLDGKRLQIDHMTPGMAERGERIVDLQENPLLRDLVEGGRPAVINDLDADHRTVPDGFIWRNRFRSFAGSPIVRKDEVLGVVCAFARPPAVFNTGDSYFLGLLASQVAIALDNARLFEEVLARDRRRDRQLAVAQKLQKDRIPVFFKQNVAAVNCSLQAAEELAGDFCDVFSLGRHSIAVVVGDVANKGVAASLMTFSLLSMFRNVAKTHKSPCEILETINRSLISQLKEDYWFATAFYGRMNTENGTLTYSSAGHERPVWYHADSGQVEILDTCGYPLGLFRTFPYETREVRLERGDRIIVYTDGVTDALDPTGSRFGHDSLLKLIARCGYLPGDELTRTIVNEVAAFADGRKQKDDIIVVALELQDDPWIHDTISFSQSSGLISRILEALQPYELDRQTMYSIRLAIDEALANAWRHGVDRRDDAKFEVSWCLSDEGFTFRVKDSGEGFDHESLPDPTVEENLFKTSGRGVFLIRKLMDEVEFNDIGNEITCLKRFAVPGSDEDAAYDALLLDSSIDPYSQQSSLRKALRAGDVREIAGAVVDADSARTHDPE